MISQGTGVEIRVVLSRLMDYLKDTNATFLGTTLTHGGETLEGTEVAISSIVDTWIMLRNLELDGERNRVLTVVKSRGMGHSNQIREYELSPGGMTLSDVMSGLAACSRAAQEARDRVQADARSFETARKRRELKRWRQALQAQIALLQAEFEAQVEDVQATLTEAAKAELGVASARTEMAVMRQADVLDGALR